MVAAFTLTRLFLPPFVDFLRASGAVWKNWRDKDIPGAAGIVFPPVMLLIISLEGVWTGSGASIPELLAFLGAAFFGLLDDWLGNSQQKGLRGHFLYLVRERKISTGLLKAGGISLLALLIVRERSGIGWAGLADWLLLVLMMNFINLLDVRPGRALKAVAGMGLLGFAAGTASPVLVGSTLGMSLACLPFDLAGKAMLGDTGSNSLGMLAGLILLEVPWGWKSTILLLLVLLHILAEKHSFSQLIARNRWLAALDEWGRAGGQGEGEDLLLVERIFKR